LYLCNEVQVEIITYDQNRTTSFLKATQTKPGHTDAQIHIILNQDNFQTIFPTRNPMLVFTGVNFMSDKTRFLSAETQPCFARYKICKYW